MEWNQIDDTVVSLFHGIVVATDTKTKSRLDREPKKKGCRIEELDSTQVFKLYQSFGSKRSLHAFKQSCPGLCAASGHLSMSATFGKRTAHFTIDLMKDIKYLPQVL
ncbi:hypothetical protein IV203_025684 [Nitzschia inconspicua]|uniref:Uncharacterized protein n=1 Tax=Nitzschia inconspicua TaxID=303405 RepID=A0A9K3LHB3_9STRA|nr:hypothetical protein IV203_025684 [Nitzschia inconspicua]